MRFSAFSPGDPDQWDPDRQDVPPDSETVARFQRFILEFYEQNGRRFPWRETLDPYEILVSELMLQQTQTERVAGRYGPFLDRFPDFGSLARAALPEVYALWKGLGYNRRAKALRDTAARVLEEHGGKLPAEPALLETFPGIGPYTARAICAFAFGMPVVLIETNVRRVFLHSFFSERDGIHDRELLPLVEATLDRRDPRRWYYALMDYGAALRARVPNPNKRSAHYVRQAPFENSNRQIRGRILQILSEEGAMVAPALVEALRFPEERVMRQLVGLEEEGMLVCEKGSYRIAE